MYDYSTFKAKDSVTLRDKLNALSRTDWQLHSFQIGPDGMIVAVMQRWRRSEPQKPAPPSGYTDEGPIA